MVLSGVVFLFCFWGRSLGFFVCFFGMVCGLVYGGVVILGFDIYRVLGDMIV